jgi:DNA-binding IclR family transcriptional regulator
MVVYDSTTQVELTTLDRTGFLFNDGTDRRIKLGSYASRVGLWISKEGNDVIDLLGG